MVDFMRKGIAELEAYTPGLSKSDIAKKYGLEEEDVIKLASNESPVGPSPMALKEIENSLKDISVYPDPLATDLREGISDYIGVKKEQIIVGNGSDEVIDLAVKMFLNPGEEVVIPSPTFSLYGSLAKLNFGVPFYVPLGRDFEFDIDQIKGKINKNTKLVFICSPNNPTGSVIARKGLEEILDDEVCVILDEAYVEFADESLVGLVNDYENLIVLRTFSKAFGLAGMRIGYGVACEEIVKYMLRIKLPFNVNVVAQRTAIGALKDEDHLKKSIRIVKKGRKFLYDNLSKISGIRVYPSKANFLLIKIENQTSGEITEGLLRQGIIVRDCRAFKMDGGYIRVSVGTMEENQRFIEEFKKVLRF